MPRQDQIETATERRPDGWSRDKSRAVAWAASLLAGLVVSWGIWVTGCISAIREAAVADRTQIKANAEAACERAASIQAQLAQIQAQLADIQRDLRRPSVTYQPRSQP